MRLTCTLVCVCILCLLEIAMFNCDESGNAIHHSALKTDDVPRVKIKVFRGPTQEQDGGYFATWGYWIQQPGR